MPRLRQDDDGAVAVLVAICIVVLLGMAAMVVDVGHMYAERRQLQNGADAAAFAVALDCATAGDCDAGSLAVDEAEIKADQNANDTTASVASPVDSTGATPPGVCGQGPNLDPCTTTTSLGAWDCPALPSTGPLSTADYVQVRTMTESGGGNLLPPVFAQAVIPSYTGSTIRACARVSWGGPAGMASAIPLTVSQCEIDSILGSPPVFAPFTPPSGYPDASWEKTLYFHDTTEAAANDCPAGPSGGDDPLDGGFGWLQSDDCATTSTVNGLFAAKTGASPGQDCKPAQLDDFIGQLVYIPVYDYIDKQAKQYGMASYVAFVLTGYNLGGGYKVESILSGSPGVYPCANDPTTGSQRCISGFFPEAPAPVSGTVGGPSLGVTVVQLTG